MNVGSEDGRLLWTRRQWPQWVTVATQAHNPVQGHNHARGGPAIEDPCVDGSPGSGGAPWSSPSTFNESEHGTFASVNFTNEQNEPRSAKAVTGT